MTRTVFEKIKCDRCGVELEVTGNEAAATKQTWCKLVVSENSGRGLQLGRADDAKDICAKCAVQFSLWWDREREKRNGREAGAGRTERDGNTGGDPTPRKAARRSNQV